jgi:hypothetical protein
MHFVFGADKPETQTLFQSGWFIEGLMTQTLIVHMIHARRKPATQCPSSDQGAGPYAMQEHHAAHSGGSCINAICSRNSRIRSSQ